MPHTSRFMTDTMTQRLTRIVGQFSDNHWSTDSHKQFKLIGWFSYRLSSFFRKLYKLQLSKEVDCKFSYFVHWWSKHLEFLLFEKCTHKWCANTYVKHTQTNQNIKQSTLTFQITRTHTQTYQRITNRLKTLINIQIYKNSTHPYHQKLLQHITICFT